LFRPFRAGPDATAANPLLVPERLAGVEAGIDHRRPNLMLSGTLFWNRLRDGIANVTLGHGPGVFPGVGFVGPSGEFRQRRNIDAILSRGVEFSAELRHGDWSMGTGFSLVDADVDGSGPAAPLDGLRPAQTPAFTFIGKLGWDQGDRSASLMVRYVGAQFEDDLNRRRLPPAATIDGFVAWPVAAGLQLVVRGENLLNKRVLAGLAADGSAERATPRTLWLGLRFGRPGRITGSQ